MFRLIYPPPFDQHAFWHYRTGCGLGLGPRPLPPYSSSINVGETLSLPTARCPLHPCPWGIEVWGLSYPTSGQTRHANRPLQLAEEVTVYARAYVQACLNTLGLTHMLPPTNNAIRTRVSIPIFLYICFPANCYIYLFIYFLTRFVALFFFFFFFFTYYLYCNFFVLGGTGLDSI